MPFEADINTFVSFTGPNRITVAVNNTLSHATIPQGEFSYNVSQFILQAGLSLIRKWLTIRSIRSRVWLQICRTERSRTSADSVQM
jgi:hypothetical protein